jgi:hypothetical protein
MMITITSFGKLFFAAMVAGAGWKIGTLVGSQAHNVMRGLADRVSVSPGHERSGDLSAAA